MDTLKQNNESINNIIQETKESGPKKIIDYLKIDTDSTIKNLLCATKNKEISLDKESGKNLWKEVFVYLENLKSLKTTEIKENLEKRLYRLYAPEYKQADDEIKVEFLAELYRVITLGIVHSSVTARDLYKSCYHKYITKKLNPNIL